MANIGVSQPYYAMYNPNSGSPTYSGLKKLGKATQVDITVDNKDPQVLYADNGPAESVNFFTGGSVNMGIDELGLAEAADILGLDDTSNALVFYADTNTPYVGLGFIVMKVFEGTVKWRLVILYKCQFKLPDYSITTKGETVEFQTPSLEAQILRDDSTGTGGSRWSKWADYTTEAAALAALQTELGSTPVTTT